MSVKKVYVETKICNRYGIKKFFVIHINVEGFFLTYLFCKVLWTYIFQIRDN